MVAVVGSNCVKQSCTARDSADVLYCIMCPVLLEVAMDTLTRLLAQKAARHPLHFDVFGEMMNHQMYLRDGKTMVIHVVIPYKLHFSLRGIFIYILTLLCTNQIAGHPTM